MVFMLFLWEDGCNEQNIMDIGVDCGGVFGIDRGIGGGQGTI
jgi:hypothetical protein